MATYKVDFYNSSSGWFHSSLEVDAVSPALAETQARQEFGTDESYYRTSIVEVVPDVVEPVDSPNAGGLEEPQEVIVNG